MPKPMLIFLAATALLSACGDGNEPAGVEDAPADNRIAAPAPQAQTPAGPDPELGRELALTAQMLQGQLPLRQQTPQGEVTISGIEARGTELVHTIEVPADLDEGSFEQFKAQLPTHMCEDSQLRQLLLRGGKQSWVIRDAGGETFTASVERC